MKAIVSLSVLMLALAGCDANHKPAGTGDTSREHPTTMIYSPNGEPLNGGPLGKPSCEQAIGGWFERLSAGSDHVSLLAFINDAQTQFHRMDIDHNGYIVSEELDRFREPYRQEQPPQPAAKEKDSDATQKDHRHKGKEGHGEGGIPSDPSLSLSDPVMSADANLDFKVTTDEFMKQARDNFTKLDTNHDDVLERAEVMTTCEKKKP